MKTSKFKAEFAYYSHLCITHLWAGLTILLYFAGIILYYISMLFRVLSYFMMQKPRSAVKELRTPTNIWYDCIDF